jgi:prepilin-type N-terminal cleavage/methylation domain-containing protein
MNKKGFTLIEILAVIVIIGIIGVIGISAISSSTNKSRKASFATLAKTYAESARSMRAKDDLPHDPKDGEVVLLRVDSLNGTDKNYDFTTEFGDVLLNYSYVAVVNNNHNFKYYVTLIDDSNHAIIDGEYSELNESLVVASINLRNVLNLRSLANGTTFSINETTYKVTSVHNTYIVASKNV